MHCSWSACVGTINWPFRPNDGVAVGKMTAKSEAERGFIILPKCVADAHFSRGLNGLLGES